MTSRTQTILVAVATLLSTAIAQKTWTYVNVVQPPDLLDPLQGDFRYHYAPVWVGNPPQLQNLVISLSSVPVFLFDTDCTYCPGNNTFDTTLSNTLKVDEQKWRWSTPELQGQAYRDDMGFEGQLNSPAQRFGVINYMDEDFYPRFREGLLGLAVHPNNETTNQHSLLHGMFKAGNMLNPVIGMRLGGSNPKITIGALDPNDYEGEINWIERTETVSKLQSSIQVEALRGRDDRILPFTYPMDTVLSTIDQDIFMPDNSVYFLNESIIGPQSLINMFPDGGFSVGCNITLRDRNWNDVYLPFSVDINGVNYPVDPKDLIRPRSGASTANTCRTAFKNSTIGEDPLTLGLSFLRSVYVAYRFPTEDCPYGHFGFAYPAGANRTETTKAQKPRTTPQHASQCLQLANPTSTPSSKKVNFAVKHQNSQFGDGMDETTYKVWGRPDDKWTPLRGVDDLPEIVLGMGEQNTFW
ncbi:hypothetical protein FRC03_011642 [Tulasnella sp. 419]|nr:hypothetical protein FRC03_011642 [Tulasnella sp. 419]